MLSFTRKTDYALIALTHMAKNAESCNSAREIAGLYGIPLPLLMNILKRMAQKGLAQSVRGPRGGYRLALAPEKISLNDIIKAVEGPVQLVQCVDWYQHKLQGKTKTGCELMAACPVRPTIHLVHARLVEFLSGVTLAEVVQNGQRHEKHTEGGQQDLYDLEAGLPAGSSAMGECSCEAANLPG